MASRSASMRSDLHRGRHYLVVALSLALPHAVYLVVKGRWHWRTGYYAGRLGTYRDSRRRVRILGFNPAVIINCQWLRSPYTDKTEFWGAAESGASTWNNYASVSQRRVAFGFCWFYAVNEIGSSCGCALLALLPAGSVLQLLRVEIFTGLRLMACVIQAPWPRRSRASRSASSRCCPTHRHDLVVALSGRRWPAVQRIIPSWCRVFGPE